MDLTLPSDVRRQLHGFEELLGSLEGTLKPFTGPGANTSIAQLESLERAQTHLALAHAAHALFQLFLNASGVDPAYHESKIEQERLKQYDKKVRKVAAEKELKESRRSLEVNVAAVNRFISAAVPDLSHDQRAALRGGGQKQVDPAGGHKHKGSGGGVEEAHQEVAAAEAAGAAEAFLQEAMEELGQGAQQQQQAGQNPVAAAAQQSAGAGKQKRRRS